MVAFAELGVTTAFSFLRGASRPGEFVVQAASLGLEGIGIADRNTLSGVVRAHHALKDERLAGSGLRLAVGARVVMTDAPDVLAYPSDRAAYGRLCRLLTLGKRRARKGDCDLGLADLLDHAEGLLFVLMLPARWDEAAAVALARLAEAAPGAAWLGAALHHGRADARRLAELKVAADRAGVPLLATNDALYHHPDRRPLQDVMTCVREGVTLERAGRRLEANAERHLKPPAMMARLFRDAPGALDETLHLLDRARFRLDDLRYEYPDEVVPEGLTPQAHLEALTWAGAAERYPAGVPEAVRATLARELDLIAQLAYAPYFLTVHDVVAFARSRGILCQGRGSAANSAVCFVLGITAVDPNEVDLLFERFVSASRSEPPDIDVDFEHERREEVIQHLYARYGRERAGICSTVISYRPRSAVREVGKVFGLTADVTARLAATVWGSFGRDIGERHLRQAGFDPGNPTLKRVVDLSTELLGFPRHLSQHVGGFVLTRGRLDETVPVGNAAMAERTFVEWDKDDLDCLGMLKIDVLALGMLTAVRKAFDLVRLHGGPKLTLADLPRDDHATYAMLSRADSLGVFQVESRAQMAMLPRMKPTKFYDLVIQVAIVRPGPIQGEMVHPYLRRRQGKERVVFPSPHHDHGPADELEQVLGRTLGVPLFQEQAMKLSIVAARFTPEEANRLRRAMTSFRADGSIQRFRDKFVEGMTARGYERAFAERCFAQIEGYSGYGFPESHAASFARIVYVSAFLKCHHPAAFACALLNSQPMGFYAPAEIVRDARDHGVEVRAVDANFSDWDSALEPGPDGLALRLGLRQVTGLRREWAVALTLARGNGYGTPAALQRRAGLPRAALVGLAEADALRSLGLPRREALWAVRALPEGGPLPLFAAFGVDEEASDADGPLPVMPLSEEVVADYGTAHLSLRGHPLQFLRDRLRAAGASTCAQVAAARDGQRLATAGLVLVRQRPGSAHGVVFLTMADETAATNVVVWPDLVERYRAEVMGASLLLVEGRVQRTPEGVVHLVARRLVDRSADLRLLSEVGLAARLSRADEVARPQAERSALALASRDFH